MTEFPSHQASEREEVALKALEQCVGQALQRDPYAKAVTVNLEALCVILAKADAILALQAEGRRELVEICEAIVEERGDMYQHRLALRSALSKASGGESFSSARDHEPAIGSPLDKLDGLARTLDYVLSFYGRLDPEELSDANDKLRAAKAFIQAARRSVERGCADAGPYPRSPLSAAHLTDHAQDAFEQQLPDDASPYQVGKAWEAVGRRLVEVIEEALQEATPAPEIFRSACEQVRKDASDRMRHDTTSDLSARLMCRVGFRELTLLLARLDQLEQVFAEDTGSDHREHRAEPVTPPNGAAKGAGA